MKTKDKPDIIAIGMVGSAAGLRGEFRINLYASDSTNLKGGKTLLFRHMEKSGRGSDEAADAGELKAKCKSVRYQKDKPVISVEGIDDRNAAEELRGLEVCIEADELDELPKGEHYVRNLIGCRVLDVAGGRCDEIGVLRDVIQNTAQSVLEVETEDGRGVLIPAVDAFMRRIDEDEGVIEVELISGLLD